LGKQERKKHKDLLRNVQTQNMMLDVEFRRLMVMEMREDMRVRKKCLRLSRKREKRGGLQYIT